MPTQKDIELRLADRELAEVNLSTAGEAAWLAAGLRLEERKYVVLCPIPGCSLTYLGRLSVAFRARHIGLTPTPSQALDLVKQRQKLSKAISSFHSAAPNYLGPQTLHGYALPLDETDFGVRWDDVGDASRLGVPIEPTDPLQPEHQSLALPSTFGEAHIRSRGLSQLAAKELDLRTGQMNDALQAIRTGIGYKSMLFRKKVRGATSTRAKLRSFDEVHVADDGIRKHVRIYMQARQAALRLFLPGDEVRRTAFLAKYKTIARDELKASTTVLEAFTQGLRDKHEAWFWTMEDNEEGKTDAWTRSCKSHGVG